MIDPKKLDEIARKLGIGKYAKPEMELPQEIIKENVLEDDEYFIFPDKSGSEYKLGKNLLENGVIQNQPYWLQREGDSTIINSRDLYQMMHRLYSLRNEDNDAVNNCISLLREDFTKNYPHTGTKINYSNGLEGTVSHLEPDKSIWTSEPIIIPEFARLDNNWSCLVLAKEQSESKLGNIEEIPDNAKPILEALLGNYYEDFGAVAQYLATRKNNNLREVRLWVPTAANRNCELCVVFGIYDWFILYADDNPSNQRPARGVQRNAK